MLTMIATNIAMPTRDNSIDNKSIGAATVTQIISSSHAVDVEPSLSGSRWINLNL